MDDAALDRIIDGVAPGISIGRSGTTEMPGLAWSEEAKPSDNVKCQMIDALRYRTVNVVSFESCDHILGTSLGCFQYFVK